MTAQDFSDGWAPLGAIPVDQAGGGRRGYVMPGDDADVTSAGTNRLSFHTVLANNFYREQNNEFLITQRYETHTLALDYRRGFKLAGLPRFEFGGQLQLHQSNAGMLNGFISGFESFWASVTGYAASRNELRTGDAGAPPLGTTITRNGASVYRQAGSGSGIGDLYLAGKMALFDQGPESALPRVSARMGFNVAGSARYTAGNYMGVGISLDQKLAPFAALHTDVRATYVLDAMSAWNLPLGSWTYAFSVGPEFRLPKRSAFQIQIDGSTTPYLPTDTLAFDKGYGAITFGVGRRFGSVMAQLYFRENMNMPFKVRWNTDPDLSVGLKIRIH